MFKNILVSVANKSGLVEFIKPLYDSGARIVSTGGTAQFLEQNGIKVIKVSDQTGFPEVMDGRVKTLHPRIHMALLAREEVSEDFKLLREQELLPFDLVVGNLYAFEEALGQSLQDFELQEFIDIGGPSFLRAAAKSFSRITTVCDPEDYNWISKTKTITLEERKKLASKVFYHVSAYDAMVAKALNSELTFNEGSKYFSTGGEVVSSLRYGENPHQKASWYRTFAQKGLHEAEVLQGKALSYNNLLDINSAVESLLNFQEPCCVAVKHNNSCGVGIGDDVFEAVQKSTQADPMSVFGGIVALNRALDEKSAQLLEKIFLECIIAPDFTTESLRILENKKNLRLLKAPKMLTWNNSFEYKQIYGGFLIQTKDTTETQFEKEWKIVGRQPSEEVKKEMLFAMKVVSHLKSNAIAITSQGQTLGLGMGQVNRVEAVQHAISRQMKYHPNKIERVLASDAFFPFADSVQLAADSGIEWFIQPGGSVKDDEVFQLIEKLNLGMVITGKRHFKH